MTDTAWEEALVNEQDGKEKRGRSYRSGAKIAKERMAREAPLDAEALAAVEASDIVVVPGSYDHVDLVLEALEMPFTRVGAAHLGAVELRPEQLLVVNCPGQLALRDVLRIRDFVAAGGSLFTTDWALRHVLEPAFPGTLEYNEHPTADDVVRVEIRDAENPFLRGVIDPGEDPLWWLEASSYPIRVLDPSVEVLLASTELRSKYGEAPVAVLFRHGQGEVFHMISHYYLQRTELREARHRSSSLEYAMAKGVAMSPDMADLTTGEVESAASSARLLANAVAQRKRRVADRAKRGGADA